MLEALLPKSFVVLSVAVVHDTEPIFFTAHILSFVQIAVRPGVLSFSVFLIVLPVAFVRFSVIALHHCEAIQFVISEVALKDASSLHQYSSAVLFVVQELAVVPCIIVVHGFSLSVGQVVLPLSLVRVARSVDVSPISVCHVVLYVSFVVASVLLYQSSFPLAASVHELAFQVVPVLERNRA